MAHGHGHGHDAPDLDVERTPRLILTGVLVLVAVLTVVGLVVWWPDGAKVDKVQGSQTLVAKGVTFENAKVTKVAPPCKQGATASGCGTATATVSSGPDRGKSITVGVSPQTVQAGLRVGSGIQVTRQAKGSSVAYAFFDTQRGLPLSLLVVAFVLVVAAVARLRGIMALVGIAVAGAIVWVYVLPALLTGEPPAWVALAASSFILYVVLYSTHGLSIRTSVALAGTLAGVAVTAAIGAWLVGATTLTGMSEESGQALSGFVADLNLHRLLVAAVIISGLGALNDVTITQASAVWELRAAGPDASRASLFQGAMRIGRDHVASTIYTIVFAYVGTALTLLMVVQLYNRDFLGLVTTEQMAGEVVKTLSASIGVVLAMPITTAIAVATVPGRGASRAVEEMEYDVEYDAPRRGVPVAAPGRRMAQGAAPAEPPFAPPSGRHSGRHAGPVVPPGAGRPPTYGQPGQSRLDPREQARPAPAAPPVRGYPARGPEGPGAQARGDHHGRQRPMGQGAWPPPDEGPRGR